MAVLAVDPSSRRSGGSLLGDRARIERDPATGSVFIRSTAAGDRLGGLAPATRAAATALAAAFDVVVIETVGVGQSETEIADVADEVAVVVQPGSGDVLQFLKSGIMEIPDVLVVTKSDLGAVAQRALADLRAALRSLGAESVPVVAVSSMSPPTGIDELVDALDQRHQRARSAGAPAARPAGGARSRSSPSSTVSAGSGARRPPRGIGVARGPAGRARRARARRRARVARPGHGTRTGRGEPGDRTSDRAAEPSRWSTATRRCAPWRDDDLPALAENGRDPDVTRWMGLPRQYRESDARAYLMSRYDGVHAGVRAPFAIVATGGGELLGSIALAHFAWEDQRGEVGYWLGGALAARATPPARCG